MAGGTRSSASGYDLIAPRFGKQRSLPPDATEAIRRAVLACLVGIERPRLLDLGAGNGRIGQSFVTWGSDYVGVDGSWQMLREFRAANERSAPRLVRADGAALPFADGVFDAVLLVQIFSGSDCWRTIAEEARRVVRRPGALIIGRTIAPADGLDARMRAQLGAIIIELGGPCYRTRSGEQAREYLTAAADSVERREVVRWRNLRTARGFLERHREGVRFMTVPEPIRSEALGRLRDWAERTFVSLDASHAESFAFELQIFRFQPQVQD